MQTTLSTIETTIESKVESHLMDKLGDKVGGTKAQIVHACKKYGKIIDPSDVADEIAMGIIWRDSLQVFDNTLKPMLTLELNTYDVGLKVNKFTKVVSYLHTDGLVYYPSYNTEHQQYYFMTPNGKMQWCN